MTVASLMFTPDGVISGLYTEAIDLACLGRLRVERATSIDFDNDKQAWRVGNREGETLFMALSRQECLDWEREHFNARDGAAWPDN